MLFEREISLLDKLNREQSLLQFHPAFFFDSHEKICIANREVETNKVDSKSFWGKGKLVNLGRK